MRRPKVVKLSRQKNDETKFVDTLVWLLDKARKGEVLGYAMVWCIENDEGIVQYGEAALSAPESDMGKLDTLGMIEKMKANYMRRAWPDENS